MDKQAVLEQHALEQLRRGDLRSAHQTLSTLLRYRPNDSQLRNRIQQVEHLVRQREEAQARIQAEPLRYAHAYIQAGRLVEGLKLLRAALAKDPSNQRLRDLALEVAARLRKQAEAPVRAEVPRMSSELPRAVTDIPRAATALPTAAPANGSVVPDESVRQEAVQRARRDAELRARSQVPSASADPARQQAVARARALAEARARGLPEPVAETPPSSRSPVPEAPSRSMPWTYDLREEEEDLEQTEVGLPPGESEGESGEVIGAPAPQVPEAPTPMPVAAETPMAMSHASGIDVPRSQPANGILAPQDLVDDNEDLPTAAGPVTGPFESEPYDSIPYDPFSPAGLADPAGTAAGGGAPISGLRAAPQSGFGHPQNGVNPGEFGSLPQGGGSSEHGRIEMLQTLLDRVRSRARPRPSTLA